MSVTINGTTGITTPDVDTDGLTVDSTTLVVDETNNRVGIGTSSPDSELHVDTGATGGVRIEGDQWCRLQLKHNTGNMGLTHDSNGLSVYDWENNAYRATFKEDGNFQFNSGYGSAATAYGVRAWAQFDGIGASSIQGSGGVSSVSDGGTGKYTINFSFTMPDTNYCYTSGIEDGGGFNDDRTINHDSSQSKTTTAYGIYCNHAGVPDDCNFVHIAFFR